MGFYQKNMDDCTYLIYRCSENEKIDGLAYKMLTNNKIQGVLPLKSGDEDGTECVYINVTSKVALSYILDKPVRKELLLNIVEGISKVARNTDEYMLDSKYFLLDSEHIYLDLAEMSVHLIYLPIVREEADIDVKMFLKNLLYSIEFDTNDDCEYVAVLLNCLHKNQTLSFDRIIEEIASIRSRSKLVKEEKKPVPQVMYENREQVVQSVSAVEVKSEIPYIPSAPATDEKPQKKSLFGGLFDKSSKPSVVTPGSIPESEKKSMKGIPAKNGGYESGRRIPAIPGMDNEPTGQKTPVYVSIGNKVNTGVAQTAPDEMSRTVIIGGSAKEGRTVLIGSTREEAGKRPQIVRVKTRENITVSKDVFKIGKEKNYADFCIRDNATISRLHAQIELHNGTYYIRDINSLNHTYVGNSDIPIQSDKLYELKHGTHFTLSDEEFIFQRH